MGHLGYTIALPAYLGARRDPDSMRVIRLEYRRNGDAVDVRACEAVSLEPLGPVATVARSAFEDRPVAAWNDRLEYDWAANLCGVSRAAVDYSSFVAGMPELQLTGQQIRRLMRLHRVSLRQLAGRWDAVTLKRIRHVREHGVNGIFADEWFRMIVGQWPIG